MTLSMTTFLKFSIWCLTSRDTVRDLTEKQSF